MSVSRIRKRSIATVASESSTSSVRNEDSFFDNSIPRSGKWTSEEETFANSLIEQFESGSLSDCEEGCTLRSYLARKLNCAPMRISKKFAGRCIGKHVFKRGEVIELRQNESRSYSRRGEDSVSDDSFKNSSTSVSSSSVSSDVASKEQVIDEYESNINQNNKKRRTLASFASSPSFDSYYLLHQQLGHSADLIPHSDRKTLLLSALKRQIHHDKSDGENYSNPVNVDQNWSSCNVGLDIDDIYQGTYNSTNDSSENTYSEEIAPSVEAEEWRDVLAFFVGVGGNNPGAAPPNMGLLPPFKPSPSNPNYITSLDQVEGPVEDGQQIDNQDYIMKTSSFASLLL